ncbi:AraC family transcriptional regulator [uncultured Algibacter sp.]|uniref:AraC family transcriptional regulator n=1 Tax=uncultured Algibacter sp. TaxID=298659 RepID=UPI00260538C1|nr:AraC family transcriptional regulator [uncultured Algibacter sp.]
MKNISEYHYKPILDGLEFLRAKSHTIDFPFHTHDTFNIALILDTTFNIKLTDKFLKVPRGVLSIVNPDEVHATPCDRDQGNSFFTFYVSPDVIKSFNNNRNVFFRNKVIYNTQLFNEFYFLSENLENASVNFEFRLTKALKQLVVNYAEDEMFSYKTTKLFQTFINESSFETFSLDKTASQFGIDKFKFIRLFKQETGLTPNNFVLLKKIEKSKQLLKKGVPILNVAVDAGFYDAPHFYKNFKRFTGVTPLVFQDSYFVQ